MVPKSKVSPYPKTMPTLNFPHPMVRRLIPMFGCFTLVTLLGACSLIETTVDLPFRAVKAVMPGGVETLPVDPIDLQEDMRITGYLKSMALQPNPCSKR